MKRALRLLVFISFSLSTVSCFSDRNATAPIDVAGDCSIPLSAIGANKTVVLIRDFTFFPDTVRVRPGTQVTWVNCETDVADPHTSTSNDGAWDSPLLNQGDDYARTFTNAGDFGYFCKPHPFMRGAVIVQ